MKKSIIIFLLILTGLGIKAQNVRQDKNGNYIAIRQIKDTVLHSTGKTYTDSKGKVYPVYVSKNGTPFINRISAKGNKYKMYLKVN